MPGGRRADDAVAPRFLSACCRKVASERTIRDAWTILCSALTNAVTEELIPKNVASLLHVSKPRKRRVKPWTADEVRRLLESAKQDRDPLYAAYVLILVLGLRKGEVVGLSWTAVNLDRAELSVGWQFQLNTARACLPGHKDRGIGCHASPAGHLRDRAADSEKDQ